MAAENPKRVSFRHRENTMSYVTPVEEAREDAILHIRNKKDKEGCEVRLIDECIGNGVFAVKDFNKGEFILEYDGELMSKAEGERKLYSSSVGSYVYFFSSQRKIKMCIDATYSKRMGRFVNDAPSSDPQCNAKMVKLFVDYRPYLALFATRYLKKGEEIRYDYGVTDLPWRCVETPKVEKKSKKMKIPSKTHKVKDCYIKLIRLSAKEMTNDSCKTPTPAVAATTTSKTSAPIVAATTTSKTSAPVVAATTTRKTSAPVVAATTTRKTSAPAVAATTTRKTSAPVVAATTTNAPTTTADTVSTSKSLTTTGITDQDADTSMAETGLETNTNMVAVMGHFHQSTPEQFKHVAAGSQCTTNCLTAIVATNIRSVENWNSDYIDRILIGGDELHLSILRRNGWPFHRNDSRLDIDEVPQTIECKIGSTEVKASVGVCEEGSFGYSSCIETFITSILMNKPNQSFILRMFGSSVAIICRGYQQYSVFDPHARNKNGFIDANGSAGLFNFVNSREMVVYFKKIAGDRDEQIDMYPIFVNVLRADEMDCSWTGPVLQDLVDMDAESSPVLHMENEGEGTSVSSNISPIACQERSNKQSETVTPSMSEEQDMNLRESKKKSKPKRPCPFCGEMKGRLTEHLKAKHKTEEKVKNALLLPKELRNRAFAEMKKEGIFKINSEMLKTGDIDMSSLLRERNQGSTTSVKMCSVCKGFFNASLIYKHKNSCIAAEGTLNTPSSVSVRNLVEDSTYTDEYRQEVLESFRDSDYGNLIRNDDWIKRYGFHLYQNIKGSVKKVEKRLSLNSKLRRLAHLFLEFQRVLKEKKNITVTCCSEMFNREYILELQEAIMRMTTNEDKSSKNGLKLNLKYLLQDVCEIMQASYYMKMENKKAEEMGIFILCARKLCSSFFKGAEESVLTKRQEELRAPLHLPVKRDLITIRDHTKLVIENLSVDGYSFAENPQFCRLRDALVCRLTLFNARRGGEPCRMLFSELTDAMNDKWINTFHKESIQNVVERRLLCDTKIAYMHASKLAKLVPVLIPIDCWKALNILADMDVRKSAGVNANNSFVFPNTKTSMSHVVGWDCVNRMCREAGLAHNVNATGMRHFAATEYAALDVAPSDRALFFKHMGHSEKINENVYQCPPAIQEITHVGRFLEQIDRMNECEGSLNFQNPEISESDVDVDVLEEFIGLLAEDVSILELLDSSKQIQENEVTVQPEVLEQSRTLLLNKKVKGYAEKFFTKDAWLAVENTLQMLDDTQVPKPVMEGISSPRHKAELKRKAGIDLILEEEVPGPSSIKIPRKTKFSAEEPEFVPDLHGLSSDEEDLDVPEGEDEEIKLLKGLNVVKTPRHAWLPEEDEAIMNFFQYEIGDVSNVGNKGKLQVTKKIKNFLMKHPEVMNTFPGSPKEKINKIRTKILNLRRQRREKYFKNMKKIKT